MARAVSRGEVTQTTPAWSLELPFSSLLCGMLGWDARVEYQGDARIVQVRLEAGRGCSRGLAAGRGEHCPGELSPSPLLNPPGTCPMAGPCAGSWARAPWEHPLSCSTPTLCSGLSQEDPRIWSRIYPRAEQRNRSRARAPLNSTWLGGGAGTGHRTGWARLGPGDSVPGQFTQHSLENPFQCSCLLGVAGGEGFPVQAVSCWINY